MKRSTLAWMLPVLLSLAGSAGADEKQIMGTVVDEKGQPVGGVELAVGWKCTGDNKIEPEQKLKSDRTGRFFGKIPCEDATIALVAFDKDRKRAGMALVEPVDISKSITVELKAAVEVSGEFEMGRFADKPKALKLEFTLLPKGIRVLTGEETGRGFRVMLPPAEYHIAVSAKGAETAETDFDIRGGDAKFAVDKLEIEPTDANAAAPALPQLSLTEARGVSEKVQLSDFKGKWVLLEIWGYW